MSYKKEVFIINGQRELRNFDEDFTLNFCDYFSNGCYVPLSKMYLEYSDRQDVIEYISNLIGTSEWDDVLIDWSWQCANNSTGQSTRLLSEKFLVRFQVGAPKFFLTNILKGDKITS